MSYTKYARIPYKAPGAKFENVGTSMFPIDVPVFDYPISVRENFKRAAERNKPMWVPNAVNDCNYVLGGDLSGLPDLKFDFLERCDWVDLFGCTWEWVPDAGGSMLKPGAKPVLDDITEWEKKIVWPDLSEDRIKACCEAVQQRANFHPGKINYYDFGQGCTERLIAVMGGYEQGLIAMMEEPEACKKFMMELSRFHIKMFDKISKYFPTDMIMYHDDWGTERDTFFSERVMDELVYEPTELFLKHVKETGVYIDFHCCGRVDRFMDRFVSLGADFVQLQERCNDMVGYKEKYGDKLGFDAYMLPITHESIVADARKNVETLGAGGGLFTTVFGGDEEMNWNGLQELYAYSREYYENH